MTYFNYDTWEITRDVIGLLICLISIGCIFRSRRTFHETLLKSIEKNAGFEKKMPQKSVNSGIAASKEKKSRKGKTTLTEFCVELQEKEVSDRGTNSDFRIIRTADISKNSSGISEKPLRVSDASEKMTGGAYEQVKEMARAGLDVIEIQKRSSMSRPEIELVIKFDRLSRLSQAGKRNFIKSVANL
jgi:hypothetical protein